MFATKQLFRGLTACLVPTLALALLPTASHAATPEHYLALRRHLHCDRSLHSAAINANPSAYVGRVIELRGVIGGSAESADGVTVMLNEEGRSATTLDLPRSEAAILQETMTPAVRVLVQIAGGSEPNEPQYKVLAVAYDAAIGAIERQEDAREAAMRKRTARQSSSWSSSRNTVVASRGGYIRTMTFAGVSELAAFYKPKLGPRVAYAFEAYVNFILSVNRHLNLTMAGDIAFGILHYSDAYNVDPRLVVAMVIAESEFNPYSRSHSGAMGLGQLMPETARDLGVQNAYDTQQNLDGSIRYLREHLSNYANAGSAPLPGGMYTFDQIALAMSAYNAGPNAVKRYHGVPPYRETQAYVNRVRDWYMQLCR